MAWLVVRSVASTIAAGLGERAAAVRASLPGLRSVTADARFGLRSLRRRPGFLLSAAIPVALGVAGVTAVFAVIDAVLLRPLPYPSPEELVKLGRPLSNGGLGPVSTANLIDVEDSIPALVQVGGVMAGGTVVLFDGQPELVSMTRPTKHFMSMLGLRPALGRGFLPEEYHGPDVALLSWDFWQRRWGGDPAAIGQTLDTELAGTVRIVGVLPRGWTPPEALRGSEGDLWTPLDYDDPLIERTRAFGFTAAAARLAPGASIELADEQLASAAEALYEAHPEANVERDGSPRMLEVRPLLAETVGDVGERLAMLLAAVGALLAIACANVANLFLARGSAREREFALRTVMGAGRGRLVVQLLVESLAVGLVGGAAGLALAYLSVDALAGLAPELPRAGSVAVDARVATVAIAVSVACGIAFGLLPALLASGHDPGSALRGGHASRRGPDALRAGLVIGQTALAVVLVTGGGLLANSAVRLALVDPGFEADDLLAFRPRLRQGDYQDRSPVPLYNSLLARLEALPGVRSASGSIFVPGDGLPVVVDVRDPGTDEVLRLSRHSVLPGYFETLGIPQLQGRTFRREGPDDPPDAVVNHAFAQALWPDDAAVDRTFRAEEGRTSKEYRVVGVVADVRDGGPREPPEPVFYESFLQDPWLPSMTILVRHEPGAQGLPAAIRKTMRDVDPTVPITELARVRDLIAEHTAEERYYALILGLFSAVALGIAAVGVYATMSYAVTRRMREMGVRRVVGAASASIATLVLRRGAAQAGAGVLLGLAVAAGSSKLLSELLYGVTPLDPLTYAAVACMLTLVALLACALPAKRAAGADPMVILRSE